MTISTSIDATVAHPIADTITGALISAPGRWLPTHAWDCHVHVFDARFALSPTRTFTPASAPLAELEAMRERLRIRHSVIVQPSVYGTDNRLMLESLEQGGGRLRGVAVIDDAVSLVQLQRMHEAGVCGVRLNLETFGLDDPGHAAQALDRLARRVSPLGWHVQVYSRFATVIALSPVLASLPCPVVLDHFAGVQAAAGPAQPGFDQLLGLLASGNVYVKLSAPSRISRLASHSDVQPIVAALLRARPDRLLWGSDWPHTGGFVGPARQPDVIEPFRAIDDGANLNQLAAWVPDAGDRLKIWSSTPANLYG